MPIQQNQIHHGSSLLLNDTSDRKQHWKLPKINQNGKVKVTDKKSKTLDKLPSNQPFSSHQIKKSSQQIHSATSQSSYQNNQVGVFRPDLDQGFMQGSGSLKL